MGFLEKIAGPEDLKPLTYAELEVLAAEIRALLVETVARTGGHLGPNLGVVELAIALHRVFDSPRDAIIWDTGHQCYVHKILTGRREAFATLRQRGGLSGYPNRSESPHDWVENSHASTSLSYALGLFEARRRKGESGKVVAVIGDGAMTGGLAYEALNQIGARKADILVILNDNAHSYAPTVGGLSTHLTRLRLDWRYQLAKKGVEWALERVPRAGPGLREGAKRLKESVKALIAPRTFFETLGLTYAGPVDGHDLRGLEEALRKAAAIRGPVLLHVATEKGKGYAPAEEDEEKLHGVGPFDVATGAPRAKAAEPSFTQIFAEALLEEFRRDPRLVAITAAMASPTGLSTVAREFPSRVYDVGIAEQHAVAFAAGLALGGLRPVVAVYSTFLQRAFDQLLLDVCLHRLPVVLAVDRAGVTGEDGPSHHGLFDLSYLRLMPGMAVAAPRDGAELALLLRSALERWDGPTALRFPKGTTQRPSLRRRRPPRPGEGEILREGRHVALVGIGKMTGTALAAASLLEREGVKATVFDARWAKPLDPTLVELAVSHPLIVTVEDNILAGGFGAGVLELLAARGVRAPVVTMGVPDRFLEHGRQEELHASLGLDPATLASHILGTLRQAGRELRP